MTPPATTPHDDDGGQDRTRTEHPPVRAAGSDGSSRPDRPDPPTEPHEARDLARTLMRTEFRERRSVNAELAATTVRRPPRSTREIENSLRRRLGLGRLGERLDPTAWLWGWLGPLVVTALAGVMRLVDLNHPTRLIFDETYYVKQAYSLLTLGYEGDWPAEDDDENDAINARFADGNYSDLASEADYVVHPQVGKWMIAVGLRLFGADNGAGWRFSAAIVGALSVLILARIARRLFGSAALGTVAGLLLAIDGVHLTESRTSLLDVFLMFWVLVGFWCVLRDREASRARLAHRTAPLRAAEESRAFHASADAGARSAEPDRPAERERRAPRVGVRWWLVAAGVALGLACGVKWSGIYAVAVFGVLVFAWDLSARRAIGEPRWFTGSIVRGGIPAFVALVPTAALTYVASWASWFAHPGAYRRQWAADLRAAGEPVPRSWLPDWLNSWWDYHLAMWDFHNGLESEHSYEAHPITWILQLRPTSFYWPENEPPPETCGAARCAEAITNLGNPVIWWLAVPALGVLLHTAIKGRDWRAWAILAGYAAMYLPWFAYAHRTVFSFYSVAFVPYVVLCLTFVVGWATGLLRPPPHTHGWLAAGPAASSRQGEWRTDEPTRLARFLTDDGSARPTPTAWAILLGVVGLAVVAAAFWWPLWSAQPVSYDFWRAHMWLPSWI